MKSLSFLCYLSDTEPLSVDGNSSELEDDEDEAGRGEVRASQLVPQTPDQEAFLKEHFVTLADLSGSGNAGARILKHTTANGKRHTVGTTNKVDAVHG